jgi:hypothetical protein
LSTYTVKNVGAEPREWKSSHGGTFLSYKVDLQEEGGPLAMSVEWNKKAESPSPAEGELVAGHLEEGKFGDKFKIDYEATKELGRGSTGSAGSKNSPASGKREWKPESQYDPEKTARIGRAHAQHMAILTVEAIGLFESVSATQIESKIKGWSDFYEKDVNAAGEAAKQASGNATPGGTESAASSPASASSASASRPAGLTVAEVSQALETAGLHHGAASTCALYMVANLEAPRLDKAVDKLTGSDLEAQASALKTAEELTVQGTGEPLPAVPVPDDDIPF